MDTKANINCQETNLAYTIVDINDSTSILASAEEMINYNQYLKSAKNNDKNIKIDFDTCDNVPYQIVYGSILYHNDNKDDVIEYVNDLKELALINIDDEFGNITASTYDDILLFEEYSNRNESIPFVALIKTECKERPCAPITLFPCCDRTVFENMINRKFLLACRKFVKIDNLSRDNWTKFIDKNNLESVCKTAEILTD